MTQARSTLISVADTPYYHVISRCVRRAFLCGFDKYDNKDYSHRRQWLIDRLAVIEKAFCIDVSAYVIMNNHYHLVLFINHKQELTAKEVIIRWAQIYSVPDFVIDWLNGLPQSKANHILIRSLISIWRKRLYSISWFMKSLNEYIARKANNEDNVTGRFWQGRFYSQALLDEKALLQCMMYVELNPIRAGICNSLFESQYTSIYQRLHKLNEKSKRPSLSLMEFSQNDLSFELKDYLNLIDWSARMIIPSKEGYAAKNTPKLLTSLGIDAHKWIQTMKYQQPIYRAAGSLDKINQLISRLNQKTLFGIRYFEYLFG